MTDKPKRGKPAYYTIDFTTALPVSDCRYRLERNAKQMLTSGSAFAPITQQVVLLKNDQFIIERTFPGAFHPIRLAGALDDDPGSGTGTWVHGAITHDTENQVLIEGLIVFLGFFFLTTLFFVRLRAESFMVSLPLLVITLIAMSLRWRALRSTTLDLSVWLRRRLYVTPDQVKRDSSGGGSSRNGSHTSTTSSTDDEQRKYRHGSNGH